MLDEDYTLEYLMEVYQDHIDQLKQWPGFKENDFILPKALKKVCETLIDIEKRIRHLEGWRE